MVAMKLSSPITTRRSANGFTLVELLVVIAIIGILVALLLPAIQAAREAARRATCQSNLKNVALAVLNYESSKKILPMGTQFPVVPIPTIQTNIDFGESWAVSILPQLEEQPLYDSFVFVNPSNGAKVPMRDASNLDERGTRIPVMLCPSDSNNQTPYSGHGGNWARGNYAANVGNGGMHTSLDSDLNKPGITGPNSAGWNGISATTGTRLNPNFHHLTRGVMGPNVSVTLKQITDGTSKTIMLGEIRAGVTDGDPRGTWAFGHAGGNLIVWYASQGDSNGPNYCGPSADDIGGASGFSCSDPQLLAQCMPCYGPGAFDQATTRSMHVGGVFVALCDGSVQFISDDIETSGSYGLCCTPWDYLVASKDGEAKGSTPPPPR